MAEDEVDYVSGRTRVFGIVGHPIEQVRSPEMVTAELRRRGRDAVLVPLQVAPEDFELCVPNLLRIRNLDGLVFTVPYKVGAAALADELGEQARLVGAINALARRHHGRWAGDMFDGRGCVGAFRRRGIGFTGRRVMLIGAGGAGAAIGVALAFERPASIRLFDLDDARAQALAGRIRQVDPSLPVVVGRPTIDGIDILMNASPVGMLDDRRRPIEAAHLPKHLIVFDAIVTPERTGLLQLASRSGCTTVSGREMMRAQIAKIVDFFEAASEPAA